MLRRLGDMLEKDPEADLASLLTSSYSTKLKAFKGISLCFSSAGILIQTTSSAPTPLDR